MRDGAEVRRRRIQRVAQSVVSLLNQRGTIRLGKTVSMLAYEFGLTKARILEYLKILEDLNRFILDEKADTIRSIKDEM